MAVFVSRNESSDRLLAGMVAVGIVLAACGPDSASTPVTDAPPTVVEAAQTATPTATVAPVETAAPTPISTLRPTATSITAPAAISTSSTEEVVERLSDIAWDELVTLTNEFSPRASATEQEEAAAEYLAGRFAEMGLESWLQPFTFQVLSRESPVLSLDAEEGAHFQGIPLTLSGLGQHTGILEDVGSALDREIPEGGLDGKIAFIERGTLTFQQKVSTVEDAGAIAAVIFNNEPGLFGGRLLNQADIPAVAVSQETGRAVKELMARGDVEATVSVVMSSLDSRNVVAEKMAVQAGDRVVVLGGHFDTVPEVPGANDNGAGIATLLTVAAEASERSYPFTLRFMAFGSEELGLFGSRSYVDSLAQGERRSIIAMLNFDALGTGNAVELLGDTELINKVLRLGEVNGLSVKQGRPIEGATSDHASFLAVGIPAVFFVSDDISRIHSDADSLDFVTPELMGTSAALGLALLDALAEEHRSEER